MAKTPQDRRPKKQARTDVVGVYADENLAFAWDQARQALDDARARWEREFPRKVQQERALAGVGDPAVITPREEALELVAEAIHTVDLARDAELSRLEQAVDEAMSALDAATLWYRFRSLGRRRYQELVAAHPAQDEDHEQIRRETGSEDALAAWHYDTFARALLVASCVTPGLTVDEVDEMFDGEGWTGADLANLVSRCIALNSQTRPVTHRPAPTEF